MNLTKIIISISALVFITLLGCREDSANDYIIIPDNATEEDSIKEDIDNEYSSLFLTESDEDGEDGEEDYLTEEEINDDFMPFWYRRCHRESRDITIHIEDGIADVTLITGLEGYFMIDVDGDRRCGKKEIQDTAVRYAVFERNTIDEKKNGKGHWKLKELSPLEIQLQNEEKRTILILKVTALVDGETRFMVDDSAMMFGVPSELPHFSPGEVVKLTAKIENTNEDGSERESYVYLHHSRRVLQPGMEKHRRRRHLIFDDGENGGDEVAGDNIFTGTYTIRNAAGFHHVGVDVLDAEMFEDETTQNYNSMAWVIPYIIEK
ncbi:MAG: hypothetical protein SVZ03_11445 [Spirochaetota bacterium]|nr:hypothetical protein [Spirochaetota bacterium]